MEVNTQTQSKYKNRAVSSDEMHVKGLATIISGLWQDN